MALSEDQIVAVRRHLGLNSANRALYPFVNTFFTIRQILTTLPAETEAAVVDILDRLDATEAAMSKALTRLRVIGVGSIKLSGDDELRALREERLAWRRELATITGCPLMDGARGALMQVH